jgi:molecular chaperone GrpE
LHHHPKGPRPVDAASRRSGAGDADRKWRHATRRVPVTYQVESEARPDERTEDPVEGGPPASSEPAGAEGLRAELQQEQERHLRTKADFEGYRRRVERDREVSAREAKRPLLLALVDLADGFDRALVHIDESPDPVAAGLHGMQRQLSRVLEAEGVKSFESVGRPFDPTRHEAVATLRGFDGPAGTVVDAAGRGYLWKDELLRPARVRVAE